MGKECLVQKELSILIVVINEKIGHSKLQKNGKIDFIHMKSATEWSRETDNYRDETCSINFIRECDTKELICLTNVEELSSIKPVATET